MKTSGDRNFFPLTSLQIGDLQSYLSDLTLFVTPESKKLYILVVYRPWLKEKDSSSAHLWQLMVTKSRMSPFANTRAKPKRKSFRGPPRAEDILGTRKSSGWLSVVDAAFCQKKSLLPVKKLSDSLNSGSALFGFIVFEVAWNDVRGINYLNELQTDTSMALEARLMRRWEFDSIEQSSTFIASWFPGTFRECLLLQGYLDDIRGEVFHDAEAETSTVEEEKCHSSPQGLQKENVRSLSELETSKLLQSALNGDSSIVFDSRIYKDVLILFRFNDHDLPFRFQDIITSDLRLLTLLESGLPTWAIFLQSYPVFCRLYRPWMCPLARALYVMISVITVLIGFYDLYKNVPVLKSTASRLCGPLFGWIENWEMLSRIKYLGTMLFLHNFEKSVKWLLKTVATVRSIFSILTKPITDPLLEFLIIINPVRSLFLQISQQISFEVWTVIDSSFSIVVDFVYPFWNFLLQTGEDLCSVVWNAVENTCNLVNFLLKILIWPLWLTLSIIWTIVASVVYPICWVLWQVLIAPFRLLMVSASFLALFCSYTYDLVRDIWLSVTAIWKVASAGEEVIGNYEVSIWRQLWNDLFSQLFRATRSILNGLVAFFATCNRHRLSIYNHTQEFVHQLSCLACHSRSKIQFCRWKQNAQNHLEARKTEKRKSSCRTKGSQKKRET